MFKANEGKTDRILRAILGLILLYLGYSINPWIYIPGAILVITAITGFCGLYWLLGIKTCPNKR